MFLFFFSSFVLSFSQRKVIEPGVRVAVLDGFGLADKGSFRLSIYGKNVTGSAVILVTESQYNQIKSDLKGSANVCLFPEQLVFYISFTTKNNNDLNIFDYTVKSTDVYYPIVFNCNNKSITVVTTFKNKDSYLDNRDKYIPIFCVIFSITYSILVILWILNMIFHSQFDVVLPKLFSTSCVLKAISLSLSAKYWMELSDYDFSSIETTLLSEFFVVAANSMLFTVNIFASFGLSSFRRTVTCNEVTSALSTTMWFFVSRRFISHTSDILLCILFGIVCLVVITSYIGRLCYGTMMCSAINESTESDEQLKLKSRHAMKFGSTLIIVILLITLCLFYAVIANISHSLLYMCEETIILLFSLIDVDFFLLKSEYNPPQVRENDDEDQIDPNGLSIFEEPHETEFAFLTTHS